MCPNAMPSGGSRIPTGIEATASGLVRGLAGSEVMGSGWANRTSIFTPTESTRGPRMARAAASTVIDRIAANMTEAMIA